MTEAKPKHILIRIFSLIVSVVTWVILFIGVLWAFGAFWFDFPKPLMPHVAACVFGLVMVLVAILVRPRWRAKLGIVFALIGVMVWWFSIQPRQFRDWKPEVAMTSHADIEGDIITLYNVRNFDYRTEKDFTVGYELRRVDLRNLKGLDIFITYWGSPYMAHPIASFDFGPDGHICFSIETRPEKGEDYSALGGLYRQFELIYVVSNERDVIRLRTNYRKDEDVYLYRLNAPMARQGFLEYVQSVNELHQTPRWYNAITNNCTTAIRHQQTAQDRKPFDWRMLVNGFGDELLYERGSIDRALPFAELKKLSHINPKAKAADADPDFSGKIREGLPGMK